jgi:hypothetical protein
MHCFTAKVHRSRDGKLCFGDRSPAGRTSAECGWRLSLPVLDPAALLTLALVQSTRSAKGQPGLLAQGGTVSVGGEGQGLAESCADQPRVRSL